MNILSTYQMLVSLKFVLAAALITVLALSLYVASEPSILQAQEAIDITITQTIDAETSFSVDPGDVVMDSSIASITGGTSNGTSSFTVQSNNSAGYNVTIAFDQDPAMQRNGGGGTIPDYTVGATETDFTFDTTGTGARFAYSVVGSAVGVVDPTFQDDTTDCGSDGALGNNTYDACWAEPATGAETILNNSSATTGAGDASSVRFRVYVPANPSPAVPAGTYTATATLTVANN